MARAAHPGAEGLARYRETARIWRAVDELVYADLPAAARLAAKELGPARVECQDCKAFRDVDVEALYRFFMQLNWWSCSMCHGRKWRVVSGRAKGAAA